MYINKKLHASSRFVRLRAVSKLSTFLCTLHVYQQNNVNPFEICNNWIQLNIVFHVIIIFCRKYENFISASDFSDFMHN